MAKRSDQGDGEPSDTARGPSRSPAAPGRIVGFLLPAAWVGRDGAWKRLLPAFAAALAIRLVLMPIATHVDLISTYHRSWELLQAPLPRWWVPNELIQAAFLVLYSPFLELQQLLGFTGSHTASIDYWMGTFIHHPQVHLALFLFKVPYLICDFAIALLMLRFFEDDPARGRKAAAMWLLNPITIFGFYVFSRHDAIAILFVVLGLYGLHRGRLGSGALALGVALWARIYPVFYLPFVYAALAERWTTKVRVVALALVPLLLHTVVIFASMQSGGEASDGSVGRLPVVKMLESSFASYLVSFRLDMGWASILFVFPFAFTLLVFYALTADRRGTLLSHLAELCACALLVLYATSFFHPQYFTWFIPFLVILRAETGSAVLRNLHYLQILLFVPYTFYWGEPLFGYLFASLDPAFFAAIPSPWDWLGRFGQPAVLVNLPRSVLSATCVFMAGWLLWNQRQRRPLEAASS